MGGSNIWVYLEHSGSVIEESSLEILGAARDLADQYSHTVTGVILGDELSELANNAIRYGSDDVLFIRHQELKEYGTELYTRSMFDAVKERRPDTLLVGATMNGRDLAARLAARLKTGLAANVVTLDMDAEGTLYSGVPGYGSKVIARILCTKNRPQMATVRAGIFGKKEPDERRKGKTETVKPNLDGIKNRVKVITRITGDTVDISSSENVIVAGNGISKDVKLVRKLSEMLGAEIGVTRPLADRGLFPRDVQVGSTGISLRSNYVIVLGSSGSEHFVTGISNCKTVIAVDSDPKSEIFDYSDYCIVGDASKIVSEMIKTLEVARH